MTEFTIRRAEPAHASGLMALLRKFHDEVAAVDLPPVDDGVLLTKITQQLVAGRVYICISDKRLVGSLALAVDQFWWSGTPYIGDVWFYVLPKYRSYAVFRAFVAEAEAFQAEIIGDQPHLVPIMFGTMTGEDVDRKAKLYQRVGFKPAGGLFVKGI